MNIKPGAKTSEFILALMPWILAIVVLIVLAVGSLNPETAMLILAGLGIGGGYASGKYAESRGTVKAGGILELEKLEPGAASAKEEAAE